MAISMTPSSEFISICCNDYRKARLFKVRLRHSGDKDLIFNYENRLHGRPLCDRILGALTNTSLP